MNPVAFAERSRAARHEAVHASASLFFDVVPDEIRIRPLVHAAPDITGSCDSPAKPGVHAVFTACGVLDGHGIGTGHDEGDLYDLSVLVPDTDERDQIMDIARRVMEHPTFVKVRDALRTRLQFRDVLYRDEIERIARSAIELPDATSSPGVPRPEAAASARRPGLRRSADKVADAAAGELRSSLPAGDPQLSDVLT